MNPSRRSGFTLVELLIVLSVILILVSMSIGYFGKAMRRSAVDNAAGMILAASDMARQLAMLDNGTGRHGHYGVRITGDGASDGDSVTVEVIVSKDGKVGLAPGAPDPEDPKKNLPLYQMTLPGSVNLWEGGKDLGSTAGSLEWFYEQGSGRLVTLAGDKIQHRYVSVGLSPLEVDQAWGSTGNTGTSHAIAPASPDHPGLSVRTPDNRYRVALSIHPNGIGSSRALDLKDPERKEKN